MKLFGWASKKERRRMFERLYELREQYPESRQVVDGCYIFYARIGKDRRKLGMEWAEKCEEAIHRDQEFARLIQRAKDERASA